MPKRENLHSLFIFISIFILDMATKAYAVKNFKVIYNKGIAFGLFAELPREFQTLTLSILFILFLFIFVLFLSFLPKTIIRLKYASSLFMGGALANVIDRLVDAKTVDFIPLGSNYFFNIADIFLIIGLLWCVYEITIHRDIIWFPSDVRKKYYIDREFQVSFLYRIIFVSLMTIGTLFIFTFIFLWMTLDLMDLAFTGKLLSNFIISYLFLSIIIIIIISGFSIIFSHRIVGPLFALKRFIKSDKETKKGFTLRKGDEMQNITNKIVKDIYNQLKKEES